MGGEVFCTASSYEVFHFGHHQNESRFLLFNVDMNIVVFVARATCDTVFLLV